MKLFIEREPLLVAERFPKIKSTIEKIASNQSIIWVAGFGSYFRGKEKPNDIDLVAVVSPTAKVDKVKQAIESAIRNVEHSVPPVSSVIQEFTRELDLSAQSPDIRKIEEKLGYLGHAIRDTSRVYTLYGQIPRWLEWYCQNLQGME